MSENGFGRPARRPVHWIDSDLTLSFPGPEDFSHPTAMSTIQPIAGELEPHPDVALVEQVRGGDVSAYDTLVRKYDRQISGLRSTLRKPRRCRRRDAGRVSQGVREAGSISRELEVLHMVGKNCSQRKPDAAAQAAHRQDGLDRRGRRDRGSSVPRDLADWAPDPEQNYNQSELAEILRRRFRVCPRAFGSYLYCATWKDFPRKKRRRRSA